MRFYRLRQPKADSREDRLGRSDAIKEEGFNVGDCVECPSCHRPLSMLKWLPPYRIELESWGKHYGDVADVGDNLIVSNRFVEVFTNSGLKGLTGFEPIEVIKVIHRRGRPKEPLPRYFKANVVRSATTIDQEASGFVWADKSKVCPVCLFDDLKRYRCLIVKEESWTGDDVFFPHGGKGPLVSERFKTAFVENDLRGAVFIPAESPEAGYDSYPWESQAESNE